MSFFSPTQVGSAARIQIKTSRKFRMSANILIKISCNDFAERAPYAFQHQLPMQNIYICPSLFDGSGPRLMYTSDDICAIVEPLSFQMS